MLRDIDGPAGRLEALSPLAVLARGYSITLKLPDRHVVTTAKGLQRGDQLETLLAQGRVVSEIMDLHLLLKDDHGSDA